MLMMIKKISMMNMTITLILTELVRQDDEYDENKLWFWVICHVYIITFEFNHFENVYYKHMLIWFV